MITLAFEQSTGTCSAALLNEDDTIAQSEWTETRLRNQHLFDVLPRLLDEAAMGLADVDLFAVGVGPGSFSGLRIAVTAARALALPSNRPVRGVDSARALAWQVGSARGADAVTVAGDARRARLWLARFDTRSPDTPMVEPYRLVPHDELPGSMPADGLVISPDWDRIADVLRAANVDAELVEEACVPSAVAVARLALRAHRAGEQQAPPVPIYLHPPVFVKPSFPATPPGEANP